jgi:nitronate monooxygenase
MFDLRALSHPVIQAPMAGGPSTVALAAAVSASGGLGFLAAGYQTPTHLAEEIAQLRSATRAPFGVNLFVPKPSAARPEALAAYRRHLQPEVARYGVDLGEPHPDDDGWDQKVDVLERLRPAVASFTFGVPAKEIVERLHAVETAVVCTVTTVGEAAEAVAVGADALCVQGPEAGGHRGTFDPRASPSTEPLPRLLTRVLEITSLPVIAAGGLATRDDVRAVLALGAVAAQAGTAFLRCPEAGTRQVHRDALVSKAFGQTAVTRAFTGRGARGLVNRFMRDHEQVAPLGYPEIHQMTSPLRRAAARAGDADGLNLWAGVGHAQAQALPAAEVVHALRP